jgi:hypothetical protein
MSSKKTATEDHPVATSPKADEKGAKAPAEKAVVTPFSQVTSWQDGHIPSTVPVGAVNVTGSAWQIARAWAVQAGMVWNVADRVLLAAERSGKAFTVVPIGSATAPATLIATLRPLFASASSEYQEQADNYVAQCSSDPVSGLSLV